MEPLEIESVELGLLRAENEELSRSLQQSVCFGARPCGAWWSLWCLVGVAAPLGVGLTLRTELGLAIASQLQFASDGINIYEAECGRHAQKRRIRCCGALTGHCHFSKCAWFCS